MLKFKKIKYISLDSNTVDNENTGRNLADSGSLSDGHFDSSGKEYEANKYLSRENIEITHVETEEPVDKVPFVPNGAWIKCDLCGDMLYNEDVRLNGYCCPKCDAHFRIISSKRLNMTIDEGTFIEWSKHKSTKNVLDFPGYDEKIKNLQIKTGLLDAVICGEAQIGGNKTAIVVMDNAFMMGSMGQIVGEKITRAIEKATRLKIPIIIFSTSGGARMQEGIVSLMQMAKTSAALKRHSDAGLFYISVFTDPTTGGVTASFAMLGDIIIAEPGALIGFAGPRVIEQTIGQKLPEGFQRAEFLMEKGFVDMIVKRNDMKTELSKLLKFHAN